MSSCLANPTGGIMSFMKISTIAIFMAVCSHSAFAGTGQGPLQKIDDSGLSDTGGGGASNMTAFTQCIADAQAQYLACIANATSWNPYLTALNRGKCLSERTRAYDECAKRHL